MTEEALSLATLALHADDVDHASVGRADYPVAPALQTSTTYRAPHPASELTKRIFEEYMGEDLDYKDPSAHIYSRYTHETRGRAEKVIGSLMGAEAITYSSGLTAAYAALVHYAPSVIAITKGYHGVHESIKLYRRMRPDCKLIALDDEYPTISSSTSVGDDSEKSAVKRGGLVVWVETPLNPTGEARNLVHYAERAHKASGYLLIDSTFGPPQLQDPFKHGADMVMHSATKYFGGHSDLLVGILGVKSKAEAFQLWHDRTYLGATPGNLESWLLLRSLRTMSLRVRAQSASATTLASWLSTLTADPVTAPASEDADIAGGKVIARVWHAGLQARTETWVKEQMHGGFPATFSFWGANAKISALVGHTTKLFTPATSLGGVESLLEHRIGSDPTEDARLVRISVGVEDVEDLRCDLRNAFQELLKADKEGKLDAGPFNKLVQQEATV